MEIALVQEFLPDNSLEAFQQGLNSIKDAANAGADLVLFPELSFSPFYPRVSVADREGEQVVDLAEPVPGPTVESVADIAGQFGVVVIFNLLERDDDGIYNTTPVVDSDGTMLGCTRMMHVPDYDNYHGREYYTPGDTGAPVYDTAAGRVGVANGYDRHYPEYLRALAMQDAELVAIPRAGISGQWPEGMHESEVRVASFQHGFFTAMANRVGQERNLVFDGRSLVTDPTGRVVAEAPSGNAIILMASADPERWEEAPAREYFLEERRPKDYERGAVSRSSSVPAHQGVDAGGDENPFSSDGQSFNDEAGAEQPVDEE